MDSLLRSSAEATALDTAVVLLRAGGLVAFPTETVYGLGADADNPLAVRGIFAAKGRPADHPLIVHLADADALGDWGEVTGAARVLARAFWPGPMTLVLKRRARVIDEVTGGRQTVGLRVPDHPLAQALLRAFGGGLAAPSANRFGRVSPTSAAHVAEELGSEVFILDGGPCNVGVESTIIDLSGDRPSILRPGGLSREEIESIIGPVELGGVTAAPGNLPAHYAPHTALRLAEDTETAAAELRRMGLSVAVMAAAPPDEMARKLYQELRFLDTLNVDVLVAPLLPDSGLGLAINDRLRRAAEGSKR